MPREALRETLERLRNELASGEPLTQEQRASLEALLGQLESLVEDDASADTDHESLAEQLREATQHFEESHPNLTLAVGAVADALARFGL